MSAGPLAPPGTPVPVMFSQQGEKEGGERAALTEGRDLAQAPLTPWLPPPGAAIASELPGL